MRVVEDGPFLRGGGARPEDWPVIGDDGSGNLFALDLAKPVPEVLFWDHEIVAAFVTADSLEAYVAECIEDAGEDDVSDAGL